VEKKEEENRLKDWARKYGIVGYRKGR
jgi:hypothetical protein